MLTFFFLIIIAVSASLGGTVNSRPFKFDRYQCMTINIVGSSGFCCIVGMLALFSGATGYLTALSSAICLAGYWLSAGPMYVGQLGYAKRRYDHLMDLCLWAKANFAEIVTGDANHFEINDLQRMLRDQRTSDEDRRRLSWLIYSMPTVGREIEVFHSYDVSIYGDTYNENPITTSVYGVTTTDLDTYMQKIRDDVAIGGWLPPEYVAPSVSLYSKET